MKFADLHLHTSFSDSTYTPEEVVREAARVGLCAIAIVDHDTLDGVPAALSAGKKYNVEVLSGIELTAQYENLEVHMLGYLIDHNYEPFKERLEVLRKIRIERIYKIVDRIKTVGVDLNPDTVFNLAQGSTVGRLHVARAMVKDGLVDSVAAAFKTYIGDKCPGYVLGFRLTPKEAVELIKEAGGIPVLAHPYIISKDRVLAEIIDCGIMGLEVYYPEHSQSTVNFYLDLAKKHDLLVTGGSDFHGDAKPEIKIGSIKLAYEFVEKLKAAKPQTK